MYTHDHVQDTERISIANGIRRRWRWGWCWRFFPSSLPLSLQHYFQGRRLSSGCRVDTMTIPLAHVQHSFLVTSRLQTSTTNLEQPPWSRPLLRLRHDSTTSRTSSSYGASSTTLVLRFFTVPTPNTTAATQTVCSNRITGIRPIFCYLRLWSEYAVAERAGTPCVIELDFGQDEENIGLDQESPTWKLDRSSKIYQRGWLECFTPWTNGSMARSA